MGCPHGRVVWGRVTAAWRAGEREGSRRGEGGGVEGVKDVSFLGEAKGEGVVCACAGCVLSY